jgi:predicted membrane-bound dolichyl-phosphate-mannose-protein mannosyltransferase
MKIFIEKNYKIIVGVILGFMLVVSLLNAWNDSAIFDETAHIGAGYSYVTQHEIRLNPEHPPMLKDLAGISAWLFAHPHFDVSGQQFWDGTLPNKWDEGQWAAGRYLLYGAGNNPDQIIFWARVPIVLLSIIFGWFIFFWSKKLIGLWGGLFALILYAFDPNILGHNHFVTTDLGIAAFITFAFYFYFKFLKDPTWKNVLWAGIFLGLVQLAKFSAITIFPILGLATIIYPLVRLNRHHKNSNFVFKLKGLGQYLGKAIIAGILSLVVVWIVYLGNTYKMSGDLT